jgi:hypothetical protein
MAGDRLAGDCLDGDTAGPMVPWGEGCTVRCATMPGVSSISTVRLVRRRPPPRFRRSSAFGLGFGVGGLDDSFSSSPKIKWGPLKGVQMSASSGSVCLLRFSSSALLCMNASYSQWVKQRTGLQKCGDVHGKKKLWNEGNV